MYADTRDSDNFAHRYAQSLMFCDNPEVNQWAYVEGIVGNYVHVHRILSQEGEMNRVLLPRKEAKLRTVLPPVQFYNDIMRGEAFFLRKKPRRQYKQTFSLDTADIVYPFWNTLPRGFQHEIADQLIESGTSTITKLGWVLNNNRYPTIQEAAKILGEGEAASVAVSKNFMVSITPAKDSMMRLWYTHIPIGEVNAMSGRVIIEKLFLLQEVKDCLRDQKCTWVVVS